MILMGSLVVLVMKCIVGRGSSLVSCLSSMTRVPIGGVFSFLFYFLF